MDSDNPERNIDIWYMYRVGWLCIIGLHFKKNENDHGL